MVRHFLHTHCFPKLTEIGVSAGMYRYKRQAANPGLISLMEMWRDSVAVPYKGVTNDGKLRKGLYKLQDDGAPVKEAVAAVEKLLDILDVKQKKVISQDLNSDVWRRWANRAFFSPIARR